MENENQEIDLRRKLSEMMKDLSYLYKEAHTQTEKLSEIMKNDNESVEALGIRLINILKTLKTNSSVFINNLYKDVVSFNSDQSETEHILTDMQSLLSECRANVVLDSHSNYIFGQQVDVETMTDTPYETSDLETLSESKELNSRTILADNLNSLNLGSSTNNGLSLKKGRFNETPQTEDELWNDTLQRTSEYQEPSIKTEEADNSIKNLSMKDANNFQENSPEDSDEAEDDICIISSNDDDDDEVDTDATVENTKTSEELQTYEGTNSPLETQTISEKVQTENEMYSSNTDFDITDKTIKDKNCEVPQPSYLEIKDNIITDHINYNITELNENSSNEKTQNVAESSTIEAKETGNVPNAIDADEYINPYSVETESNCSNEDIKEEYNELVHTKTIHLYDEHSYSASSNESDNLLAGSSDSNHVKDSGNKINSTNTNQIDSSVEESLKLPNDAMKDTNNSDENQTTEAKINRDKCLSQNHSLTPTQLDYELSHLADKIDSNESQTQNFSENYIHSEHNYSSSNSPNDAIACNYDSDVTDIDKNDYSDSEKTQLKSNNFYFEVPEEQTSLQKNDSDKSFEFDITTNGDLGLDDTIIAENKDATKNVPEQTFTPEPTNNNNVDDTITDENKDATKSVPDESSAPEPTNINNVDDTIIDETEDETNSISEESSSPKPTTINNLDDAIIDENTDTSSDENEDATIIDENTDATIIDENTDTPVIDENTDTPVIDENTQATIIDENTDATILDENTDATIIDENTDATIIDENTDATIIDENTDATIIDENTDATNRVPQESSTPEPTNINNVMDDNEIIDENTDATNRVSEESSASDPTIINNEAEKHSETSENLSDDDLMDCTLEEYLSEDENGCHLGSPTIKPDITQIKIEKDNESTNELKIECENKPEVIDNKDLGDEILELLKEVPVAIDDLQSKTNQCNEDKSDELDVSNQSNKDESDVLNVSTKEIDQILQDLNNESKSDTSSSDDNNSDLDLSDDSDDEVKYHDTNSVDIEQKLQENNMRECYIPLKRMDMAPNDIRKFKRALDDDIDWLCNLDNLERKRKKTSSPVFGKRPRKKWKKKSTSGSSTDSFSESSSDNENSEHEYRSDSPNLGSKSKKRLYEILANAICNDLKSESSEDSDDSSSDSDDSSTKKKKSKKNSDTTKSDTDNKRQMSKEELQKKAWRNDPLLRDKLTDSDRDTLKSKKTKTYEDDSEFNIDSDHFNTDSDLEDLKENKTKLKENDISPIKGNLPDSDSSDSDSDVQYISPKKSSQDNKEDDIASPSQKGRRHIRSILSDRDLTRETLEAKKQEMQRIERIKDRHKIIETLTQSFSSQHSEDDTVPLILDVEEESGEPLIQVNNIITKKLKPHQREGIQFMWDSCYESIKMIKKGKSGSGCILAHCMGLGKTLQVLALCHTLFFHKETNTKHVLVVCPLSTVNNWRNETKFAFQGLTKDQQFSLFSITGSKGKQSDKYKLVENWHLRKKSILIMGYECFEGLTNHAKLDKLNSSLKKRILEYLVDPGPDLVVCDEGHLIKNHKALRTLALNKIKTRRRIILTGTPLQNNLLEYYEMVNFVKPNLLGTLWEFKRNFVNPISNGQYEDSNELDIKLMMKMTHVLHKLLVKTVQRFEETELEIYLPPMLDHAVFIQLNQMQVNLYNLFSQRVETRLTQAKIKRKQFLGDFHTFQHIGTHPHLLVLMDKQRNSKVKEKDVITNEEDQNVISEVGWWKEKMPADTLQNISYGNKLVVLKAIIEECEAVEDKLLVFSQSLCEMDLIEHFLKTIGTEKCSSWRKKVDYFRMDGTVSPEERSTICDMFNDKKRKKVRLLLMSTKVGGLGLNLTAANRVVIMTVHWNPSYDTQSVFRAYRFGQQKSVYVYRLIALDTMESKVYQRQVTKLAIAHRVVDKHHITRHYKSIDLQEMYSCIPNADDERPTPNVPEDEILAKVILKLPCIFKYHEHKALLADRPEDKLSEQEMAAAWEDFKNNKDAFRNPSNPPLPQPHYLPQDNYPFAPSFKAAYNLGHATPNNSLYYMPPQNNSTFAIPSTSSAPNPIGPYRMGNTNVNSSIRTHPTPPYNQGRIVSPASTMPQGLSMSNTNVNSSIRAHTTPQGRIVSLPSTSKQAPSTSNTNNVNSSIQTHTSPQSNQGRSVSLVSTNKQAPSMSNTNVNSSIYTHTIPQSNQGRIVSLASSSKQVPSMRNTNVNSNIHTHTIPQSNQGRIVSLASTNKQAQSVGNANVNSSIYPYNIPQGTIISLESTNPQDPSTSNVNVNSNNQHWSKKVLRIPPNINHVSKENTIKKPRIVLANKTKYDSQKLPNPLNTSTKPDNLVENPYTRPLVSSGDVVSHNPLIIKISDPNMSSISSINSLKRISLKENSMPPSRSTLNSTDLKRKLTTEEFVSKNKMPKKRTEIYEQINLTEDDDNSAERNEHADIEVIQIV